MKGSRASEFLDLTLNSWAFVPTKDPYTHLCVVTLACTFATCPLPLCA